MTQWFTPQDKLLEALAKQAIAQHVHGYLDPRDAGSAYDCTVLVPRTYEIKHDWEAAKTGNLYFEIHNTYRNTPSGLSSTQADQWAHLIPGQQRMALYPPKRMLRFLQDHLAQQTPGIRLTPPHGGDQNSQGIVAPIALILAQSFVETWGFQVEIGMALPSAMGAIWRCPACQQLKAIETFRQGLCLTCAPHTQEAHALGEGP